MPKTLLVIGAHADDNELGAGLTSLIALKNGFSVINLCLSQEGKRIKTDLPGEWKLASERIGYTESIMLDFKDCMFYKSLMEIITSIEEVVSRYSPVIAITHSQFDTHQDHRTTYEAARVALRKVPQVLLMQGPSTDQTLFQPIEYQSTKDSLLAYQKVWALSAYTSQCDIAFPQALISQLVANGRLIKATQDISSVEDTLTMHGDTIDALTELNPLGYSGFNQCKLRDIYLGHMLMHPPGTIFSELFGAIRTNYNWC